MNGPAVSELPDVQRDFIEQFGLWTESSGGTRTAGRILGWLLICDPPYQSITELATAVAASKASISTVIRQLHQAQFVERVPVRGSQQHYYQLRSGGWVQIITQRLAFFRTGLDIAELGYAAIDAGRSQQRERLDEFTDLLTFMDQDFGGQLVRRWAEYRDEQRTKRGVDGPDA